MGIISNLMFVYRDLYTSPYKKQIFGDYKYNIFIMHTNKRYLEVLAGLIEATVLKIVKKIQ